MKILITGAAGGIGSSLGYSLYKLGHNLTLVDSFRNGYKKNLFIDGDMFGVFHELDIRNNNLKKYIPNQFDCIIHLAAVTALPDCEINSKECIDINVTGTLNILNYAKKIECPHIIFASTSAVYENNTEKIFTENLSVSPSLLYSSSKKMAEDLCISAIKNYGMNISILRFFNVFGPRQDIHRKNPPLVNYIVKQIKQNKSPVFHGTGIQQRDYIHIDDVISFINFTLQKKPSGIYNVCSGELLSVNDIFYYIAEEYNFSKPPKYRDASMLWDTYPNLFEGKYSLDKMVVSKETNKYSKGSFQKAFTEIGWKPNTDLKTLIKQVAKQIKI